MDKVALVTGANKGIGYGIVRELCKRGVKVVYLASRDLTRGREALDQLNKEGLYPQLIQLEVTDEDSVKNAANYIKNKHGGLDILVNNAAVVDAEMNNLTYEDATRVINVNYRSFYIIEEYLYPILNQKGRVVNIASDCGHISNLRNKYWIDRLTKADLNIKDVEDFINWFLETVKNKTIKKEDFAETSVLAYRIAKISLVALTRIQQNKVGDDISINAIEEGSDFKLCHCC